MKRKIESIETDLLNFGIDVKFNDGTRLLEQWKTQDQFLTNQKKWREKLSIQEDMKQIKKVVTDFNRCEILFDDGSAITERFNDEKHALDSATEWIKAMESGVRLNKINFIY